MKQTMRVGAGLAGIVVAGTLWFGGGCEVLENLNLVLVVTPSSTNLTATAQTVVFSVSVSSVTNGTGSGSSTNSTTVTPPVVLPLQWFVSDPALGTIQAAGAYTAVYERNGDAVGNNFLRVEDATGRYEGVAVVSQSTVEDEEAAPVIVVTNAP